MNVTRRQLIEFNNALHDTAKIPGVKFAYANSKNRKKMKSEMNALIEAQQPHEDYQAYEEELRKLVEEHAERDEEGNLKRVQNEQGQFGFTVAEDNEDFAKAHEELKEKHAEALENREKQMKDYEEHLDEEIDSESLGIHKIAVDDLPQQVNGLLIDQLELMIE